MSCNNLYPYKLRASYFATLFIYNRHISSLTVNRLLVYSLLFYRELRHRRVRYGVKENVNEREKNGIKMDKEGCAERKYHGNGSKWNVARMTFIVRIHEGNFTIARGKEGSTWRKMGKKETWVRLLLIDGLIYCRMHLLMMNIGRKHVAPATFTLFARQF